MREILKKLNQDADVLGSMVMTPDGIMVAAAVNSELEEDVVAAFASSLLITLKRSINQLKATSNLSFCYAPVLAALRHLAVLNIIDGLFDRYDG